MKWFHWSKNFNKWINGWQVFRKTIFKFWRNWFDRCNQNLWLYDYYWKCQKVLKFYFLRNQKFPRDSWPIDRPMYPDDSLDQCMYSDSFVSRFLRMMGKNYEKSQIDMFYLLFVKILHNSHRLIKRWFYIIKSRQKMAMWFVANLKRLSSLLKGKKGGKSLWYYQF